MDRTLADLTVGDIFGFKRKKFKVICKHLSDKIEKIPEGGIPFRKNPHLMHIVVEDMKTHTQQEFTGDKIVNYERRGKKT
ncbi:hypothetical protein KJA17_01870 [Patescibacteria group bacterium]|nr:hypothetical protein [Patescibacteria group bacterium]